MKSSVMKNVILEGIKNAYPLKDKKPSKNYYTISGPKQETAASALRVLGALNSLNTLFSNISTYARKLVFGSILPQWLKDVIAGDKPIKAFTVTSGDAKALIVPMKKYAPITEERAGEIYDLKNKFGVDLEINEVKHYVFNQTLVDQIPEEKMSDLMEELTQAMLKSKVLPATVKKEIRSGRIAVIDEQTEYKYSEDVLTNLPKYAEGDVKTAMAVVDTVKPVFSIRSFELEDKEVQVGEALDLIKENMDIIPEAAAKEEKPKRKSKS
jgi:hypothetical protein